MSICLLFSCQPQEFNTPLKYARNLMRVHILSGFAHYFKIEMSNVFHLLPFWLTVAWISKKVMDC